MTDLRDDLAPLLELEATPIAALAERRRHRRARRRVVVGATGAVVAVLVGTGLVAAFGGDDDPGTVVADDPTTVSTGVTEPRPDPTTTTAAPPIESEHLVVVPATVQPGAVVDVFVLTGEGRGVDFVLSRWDGTAWAEPSFLTISDGGTSYGCRDCRTWTELPGEIGIDDLGVGGPGPDRMTIPPVAEPGRWRLCSDATTSGLCGTFEVAGDAAAPPEVPPAEPEPARITTSRWLARPGEALDLTFPQEDPRGLAFTLARWDGGAWTPPIAQLHSNAAAYDAPSVQAPGATVPDVQVNGRGPDHVVLPDAAEPGWYRICFDGGCTQVRILDPLPEPTTPTTAASTGPSTEPSTSTTAPGGPPPEAEPAALVVSPDVVAAGVEADLWFPTQATRGIPFLLQRWDGGAWAEPSYVLYSGWGGGTPYWEAGGTGASRLPAFLGLGPDRVVIPDVAEPGTYRVCADVSAGPCGQLEIRSPSESPSAPIVADVSLELWHCGILPTEFAGETWIADPVPIAEGGPNPPGATTGTMTQLLPDPDEARYVGSDGTVVRFVRLEGEWDPPLCR